MKFATLFLLTLLILASACSDDDNTGSDKSSTDRDDSTDGDRSPSVDAGKTSMDASHAGRVDAASDARVVDGSAAGDPGGPTKPDAAAPVDTTKSTGPGDWVAGDYPADIASSNYLEIANLPGSQGRVRQYKVHVPKGYDPNKPAPLLFCFHGLGQDAVFFCVNATGLPAKSDAEGFILVMPNGLDNSWDAGTCCSSQGLDEPEFIRAVFTEVGKHLNIDLGRVYATGLSNGGYLSFRLGCEMSDVFVAIAPSAGAVGLPSIGGGPGANSTFSKCEPKQSVSVLELHGTADPLVPYAVQEPSLELMAKANGCSLTTAPAKIPMSGGDTSCVTYAGCPTGIEVTGCTVQGGGHCWFGDPSGSCGTGALGIGNAIVGNDSNFLKNTDAAWAFVSRFSR